MYNIGQGTVNLLDHNEEYVVTFPSGFGRSILTVPWVELGGKVSVNCPQTGYMANIEFKCKQFFSSDVNKVKTYKNNSQGMPKKRIIFFFFFWFFFLKKKN